MRIIVLILTSLVSAAVTASESMANRSVYSDSKLQGKIYFLSDTYTTPLDSKIDLNSSDLFVLDLKAKGVGGSWSTQADFQAGHYSGVNRSYLAVREMFYEYKVQKIFSSFFLGRRREDWSVLERNWSLSLWEPQFMLDALRPIGQGLSGLSFRVQQEQFSFAMFISSIYVPNMGVDTEPDVEGNIKVKNRWAKQPIQQFPFNGKSTHIIYSLDSPSVSKIVNQKSVALVSRFGSVEAGPWVSVAVARKPVNDLVLSYRGVLRLGDDGSYGDVKIIPHVINHEIGNFDLGYKWQDQDLIFSHLEEKPFNIKPVPGWSYQQFEAIMASSVKWKYSLYSYLNEKANVSIGRLRLYGGHITELDSEMHESHVLDGVRVRFTDAWAIDFQTPILGGSRSLLSSKIHFVRDIVEQASLFNAEFYIKPSLDLNLVIGADVIGVRDNSELNKSKSFLNQNRANDRVYAGISYVF